MNAKKRLPLGQALLGLLMQGPLHGYDLHRCAKEELGPIWHMGISNIYGTLKQLEKAGHVESSLSPQDNRPTRKIYRITRAGRKSFRDWVRQPATTIWRLRVEFLAKLYFLHTLGLKGAHELIAAQETICQERIAQLQRSAAERDPQDFDRIVFDFRHRQIEAILSWLEMCREELTS
ncbi:MAG: PadR family transcriptional regulator [Anaerolineae bacterium]|nr:PadR family transcriptional regulator [Anaerolineae bacterium]